jgi:streptogramin lyase
MKLACLALVMLAAPLAAQSDYWVSSPAGGGIYKGDFVTGASSPIGLGLQIPHYGWFGNDGNFYVPDRGWNAIMKITPAGAVSVHAGGGGFIKPVTCIPTTDDTAWVVSDMEANAIFRVGYDGSQTVMHDNTTANGLLNWPDGMAYDDAGNLYVANLGNDTIVKIDPTGAASLYSDSDLISEPGGLALDGAGNLYAANYASHTIIRFILPSPVAEVHMPADVAKLAHPNDLKLSRKGGLLSSARQGAVGRIDALGNATVVFSDPTLQELDGVSVPEDATLCSGRFVTYGTGTAGTGGIVPQMRAIYSPCPGQIVGLEMRDFLGSVPAVMFLGLAPLPDGVKKFKGATLLVDPSGPFFLPINLFIPGDGAGQGRLVIQAEIPAGLTGLHVYHQVFAGDPAAVGKVSASNGLHEIIGS